MANYSHDDIHSVAERFLREHLANAESQSKTVRTDGQSGEGTDAEAEPPEIEEPEFVILSRRSGNATSYFYGWKSQRGCSHIHNILRKCLKVRHQRSSSASFERLASKR